MPSKVNFDYYSISDFNSSIDIQNSVSHRAFSILNCNIRSLNANFDHLTQMLVDLNFLFTLIGVTETWINPSNPVDYHLPGYTFISQPTKVRAGGVEAFIRNDTALQIRDDLSLSTDECEILSVEILNKLKKYPCMHYLQASKLKSRYMPE